MKKLNLIVTEGYFKFNWWAPYAWSRDRRRYWEIIVVGYGVTQAIRKEDIELMAIEYAALQEDAEMESYRVGEIRWR